MKTAKLKKRGNFKTYKRDKVGKYLIKLAITKYNLQTPLMAAMDNVQMLHNNSLYS